MSGSPLAPPPPPYPSLFNGLAGTHRPRSCFAFRSSQSSQLHHITNGCKVVAEEYRWDWRAGANQVTECRGDRSVLRAGSWCTHGWAAQGTEMDWLR
jgi:hypothetical protein